MAQRLKRSTTDPYLGEHWRRLVYRSLNKDQREIRILELWPSSCPETEPECSMFTSPLGKTNFAAISYVWGDDSDQLAIHLNGHRVKIGRNAHTALRYIREVKSALNVWIDCLCVNQRDIEECNNQVKLMGDVFRMAFSILIWTGTPTRDEDRALDTIRQIPEEAFQQAKLGEWTKTLSLGFSMFEILDTHVRDGLCAFLDRTIWSRIWVVQETSIGRNRGTGVLIAGRTRVPYNSFIRSLLLIHETWGAPGYRTLITSIRFPVENHGAIGRIAELSRKIVHRHQENTDMSLVYNMNRTLDAKDPRDRIYGFLGLIGARMAPDYSLSVEEVYRTATVAFLQDEWSLRLLLQRRPDDSNQIHGSPSWVVNWAKPRPPLLDDLEDYSLWSACGGRRSCVTQYRQRHLVLGSCKVFTIAEESILGPNWDDLDEWHSLKSFFRFAERHLSTACATHIGNDWTNALWRTILWDRLPRGQFMSTTLVSAGSPLSSRAAVKEFIQGPAPLFIKANLEKNSSTFPRESIFPPISVLTANLGGFRIALSPCRRLCLLPNTIALGDSIHILDGAEVPVVLRSRKMSENWSDYELVGPAYVHGLMDGEAIADSPKRVSTGDPDAYDSAFEMISLG